MASSQNSEQVWESVGMQNSPSGLSFVGWPGFLGWCKRLVCLLVIAKVGHRESVLLGLKVEALNVRDRVCLLLSACSLLRSRQDLLQSAGYFWLALGMLLSSGILLAETPAGSGGWAMLFPAGLQKYQSVQCTAARCEMTCLIFASCQSAVGQHSRGIVQLGQVFQRC